jgi:CheY-like chemotaxis protein
MGGWVKEAARNDERLVLVVAAAAELATRFTDAIAEAGYTHAVALGAREAIDVAFRRRPIAVVVDLIQRPEEELQIVHLLRRPGATTRQVPLVGVVSSLENEHAEAARHAGCSELLAWPGALDEAVGRAIAAGPPRERPILVVEDDDQVRQCLVSILAEEGHEVLEARDGHEALEVLRNGSSPKLVLLDLMMPDMDGWQFRAEQLRDETLANIPVVVVTAVPLVRQRLESLGGVADTIQKPFDVSSLLSTIARHSAT